MNASPPDLDERFFLAWANMAGRLKVDPFDMIRVAYSESDVRASAHNPHGHASGLIQFMPRTLEGLGWTKGHEAFRQLSAADQVPFCERYFRPHAKYMRSDALCYVVTFLPALVSTASQSGPELVLCSRDVQKLGHWPARLRSALVQAYAWNPVLDRITASGALGRDGDITTGDLAMHLELVCKGARYHAIVERLRQAMGLQPTPLPEPEPTLPDLGAMASDPDLTPEPTCIHDIAKFSAALGDDIAQATLEEIEKRHSDE